MNRMLQGVTLTAFAICTTVSCSDSQGDVTGVALDDPTANDARVYSATVTVADPAIPIAGTTQATAALYDRWHHRLYLSVVWQSSDSTVATVSSTGLVKGVAAGAVSIIATRGYTSGQAALTVTSDTAASGPPVASVSVSLAATSITPGQTTQATAVTRDANNNALTGRSVAWSSDNTAVATVDASSGVVTAVAAGSALIKATSEGQTGSATINVAAVPPPSGSSGNPGTVADLKVSAIDSTSATLLFTQVDDGTGRPAQYDVRFAVAPISWGSATSVTSGTCSTPLSGTAAGAQRSCTVQGLKPGTLYNFQLVAFRGTMNFDATYGGVSNVAAGTTTSSAAPPPSPVPVASISVSPSSSALNVGATVQLSAQPRDANNNLLTGRAITWTSSNVAVARVSSTGLVTAVAAGTSQVTATSEGKSGSAAITVNAPPPPPPPPTGSNEPSGLTVISDRPFNSTTSSYVAGEDGWWDSDNGALAIVQDATAPRSPSNVARMTFGAGMTGGWAPSTLERPLSANTIYVSTWIKLSTNWQSHNSSVNKILHFWIGGLNRLVITAAGYSATGPLTGRISLQQVTAGGNNPDGGVTGTYNSNVEIVRGAWTRIEVVAVANTAGSRNGTVALYINGVLATSCSGIEFTSAANPWSMVSWSPTWGGTGDTVQSTMYEYMDHIYISGK